MSDAESAIERIYEQNEGSEAIEDYFARHGVQSMGILTITSELAAKQEVLRYRDRISGKRVIEIGSGVGFLALELARHAKTVVAIEADPAWSWVFTEYLYEKKPKNLTWIFGAAETVVGWLRGDVAVVYTRSDIEGMTHLALQVCPEIILGPKLSLEERHPEATKDERAAAEQFAATITPQDIISRHGVSGKRIRAAAPPEVTDAG